MGHVTAARVPLSKWCHLLVRSSHPAGPVAPRSQPAASSAGTGRAIWTWCFSHRGGAGVGERSYLAVCLFLCPHIYLCLCFFHGKCQSYRVVLRNSVSFNIQAPSIVINLLDVFLYIKIATDKLTLMPLWSNLWPPLWCIYPCKVPLATDDTYISLPQGSHGGWVVRWQEVQSNMHVWSDVQDELCSSILQKQS